VVSRPSVQPSTARGALSWAGSAHLAVEGWTDGRLTTAYTRAALERCQLGLEETRTSLATAPLLGRPRVSEAAGEIAQMSALAATLAEAVGKDDRAGATRSAGLLAAAAARLREGGGS